MIGTSNTVHQWWQRINTALGGFALGQLPYAPIRSSLLLIALGISGTLEQCLNKRDVSGWREGKF